MKKCKLIAIAAVSVDGVIGIGNEIPWKISEDFKHFRKTTMGNTLIIGYNTYLSLPDKAFEGRNYIVLVDKNIVPENKYKNVTFVNDFNSAKNIIRSQKIEKVFVAGGAFAYNSLIEECDEAIITWINKMYPEGDKHFPIDKLFNDFEVINDTSWNKSESGISYKIVYYRKENHNIN